MNELAGHFEVKLKYNCMNIVTEQSYPGLHHPWIVFLPDTEQRLLFSLLHFEANDFPVTGLGVSAVTSAVMAQFKWMDLMQEGDFPEL